MQSWNSASYLLFPFIAGLLIGVFVLVLRWAFSSKKTSVVAAPPKRGAPTEYGMLVPVASPETFIEAEMIRRTLIDHGIRANVASTTDGPRVMVWPADVESAKKWVSG